MKATNSRAELREDHATLRMTLCLVLACAALIILFSQQVFAQIPVTVTLQNGSTTQGEATSITGAQIVLTTPAGVETLPTEKIMLLDVRAHDSAVTEAATEATVSMTTADQSQLTVQQITTDGTTVKLESRSLGEMSFPLRQLSDLRFGALDGKIDQSWQELRARTTRDDLLVVRKGDVLDYVGGSLAGISDSGVTMLVRGRSLTATKDRVFGVILATGNAPPAARRSTVRTLSGDSLQATDLQLKEGQLVITTTSIPSLKLPAGELGSIDFGGGRIRYLADLTFDAAESKSPDAENPVVWFVSKNSPAGTGGKGLLRIGQQDFPRGLWLHSGAVLKWRLNREYTALRATAGFEQSYVNQMPRFNPKVRLVILGDDRELLKQEFVWNQPAVPIEVSLSDVRVLTIRLESLGEAQGVLEHFGLGDAQAIR